MTIIPEASKPNVELPETQRSEILYTAMFLTAEAQQELLAKYPPKYDTVHATHSTNAFRDEIPHGPIIAGNEYTLKVIGVVDNGQVQVVLVENPFSQKAAPHITISCAIDPDTNKPYPPSIANTVIEQAIEDGSVIPITGVELNSVSGYFTKSHTVVTY